MVVVGSVSKEPPQMLSAATLNRVSHSYRRGYNDAAARAPHANKPVPTTEQGIPLKPFSDHDYDKGYRAGANDLYWGEFYANRTTQTRDQFLADLGVV